jgi:hypothetical protein
MATLNRSPLFANTLRDSARPSKGSRLVAGLGTITERCHWGTKSWQAWEAHPHKAEIIQKRTAANAAQITFAMNLVHIKMWLPSGPLHLEAVPVFHIAEAMERIAECKNGDRLGF